MKTLLTTLILLTYVCGFSQETKYDTIPMVLLVSDTARPYTIWHKTGYDVDFDTYIIFNDTVHHDYIHSVFWIHGYEVREYSGTIEVVEKNGSAWKIPVLPQWDRHIKYLNSDKEPINYVVWDAIRRN